MYLILGSCYLVLGLYGSWMIKDVPEDDNSKEGRYTVILLKAHEPYCLSVLCVVRLNISAARLGPALMKCPRKFYC